MSRPDEDLACPCGSSEPLSACCGALHAGGIAVTAEALMRSRYSAYVLRLSAYLLDTWHASTRPPSLAFGAGDQATHWLGLSIRERGSSGEDSAIVEFIARYKLGGGSAKRLHERSRFLREHGRWFYLDGEIF